MKHRVTGWLRRIGVLAALIGILSGLPARAQTDQEKLIAEAEATFSNFLGDSQMQWIQANIGKARGVLIIPQIVKAGFILGGSGGRGALFVRDPSGRWLGPAFYSLATGSIGFQAGVEVSEALHLVMSEKAINSLMSSAFKIGPDVSVAAGPLGAGRKETIQSDIIAFSRAQGLYGGLNFDGTAVTTSDDWNRAYYGKSVLPPDILIRKSVSNKHADRLRNAIGKAAARR